MRNRRSLIRLLLGVSALASLISSQFSYAIVITASQDATELANTLLVPGSGITINSAILSGGFSSESGDEGNCEDEIGCGPGENGNVNLDNPIAPLNQAGLFTNASGVYNLPAAGGIVFSTGNVTSYQDGPNTSNSFGLDNGSSASQEQNDQLSPLTGQLQHFDPVQLDISFTVDEDSASTITFFGAFGSEEFPEFVDSGFVDGFGLFVNGQNVAGALPTGASPGDELAPININHPDFLPLPGTELNGVLAPNGNPLLRFDVPVQEGVNTFRLLLADASDGGYDSTIFLASFGELGESPFTPILPDPSNPTNEDGAFVFTLPDVQQDETIWFDPDVASGYTYTSSLAIATVTAPPFDAVPDPDGYILEFMFNNMLQQFALNSGETFDFVLNGFNGVTTFSIQGINLDLALDPDNPQAFVTGVSFAESGALSFTQDPITVFVPDVNDIPEPASILIISLGLGGLALRRRKI
ncbi:choice-of-anchor L family PEP-CTERM protein [Thalassotalea euphylliae]|uniref:PEP-CTERM sorting domain-containing protein n=1 Tax=Thalassotalea euphylliae TaxID=1655234 RepID=A0A3E0UJT5_9GAMM|nr:choice-of-anchor L domain-containing protein [Thalassotalea euphylliae]REL37211.1 PEP-CTERM sorting domain-containing protein [Thalassotalea euphylliae]